MKARAGTRTAAQPLSLKARAIALLAQREHSAMELRRKLLRIARERAARDAATAAAADAGLLAGAGAGAGARTGLRGDVDACIDEPGDDQIDAADAPDAVDFAEQVDAVLAWLQASGYLDETRFVESRLHLRSQRFGQRRIEQELAQHGLSLDAEQRAQLSAGELDRACDLLRRKFGDTAPADSAAEAKRMRFLIGRGFGSEVVRRAIRQIAAGIDPND